MTDVNIRRLTDKGLLEFETFISTGGVLPAPVHLLSDPSTSEEVNITSSIDITKTFANRVEFAEYAVKRIGSEWDENLRWDSGFWSWWALAYFDQFRGSSLSRSENYIFNTAYNLYYRHCAATPIFLVMSYGADDAKLFISNNIGTMGEMLEQCMSRQYLVRSKAFREVVRKLYYDSSTAKIKSGTASKPPIKKKKDGTWGSSGKGSIRRFALEVQRLYLTYNLEEMSADGIIELLGVEYDRFSA